MARRLHPPNEPDKPYRGTLIADRLGVYDALLLALFLQQKCIDHVIRSIKAVLAEQHPGARSLGNDLLAALREARDLWREFSAADSMMTREASDARAQPIKARVTHLLRERPLCDEGNARLVRELGTQQDWGRLLRFVDDPAVEPTNNRAKRDLRFVVVARKT